MKYLLAAACLLGLTGPILAQESRATQTSETIADGIALTVRGYANSFDRYVLQLVPIIEGDGFGNAFSLDEKQKRYQVVQKEIARALAPFGITEQTRVTPVTFDLALSQMPGGAYAISFVLPQKFDGKKLGSGTIAEVMGAAAKAGAAPVGQLISSYNALRVAQARLDAVAEAMRIGRLEATEISILAGQKVGKVLGIRVENGGFLGTTTRRIDTSGIISEQYASNSVTLLIRFAMN